MATEVLIIGMTGAKPQRKWCALWQRCQRTRHGLILVVLMSC